MNELEYLLSEIKDRIGVLQRAAGAGNCSSYDEYKYTCGQIRGLESACLIIMDLNKKQEENFDD